MSTPIPRLTILSTIVDFEAGAITFPHMHARLEAEVGPIDPLALGELWALVVQLADSAGLAAHWVAFLNSEIDQHLADMLTRKVQSNA